MDTDQKVHPIIKSRWSARALSDELMTETELFSLFEAARLAPSSFNNQPWRFIYARRESKAFMQLFDLMVPFNQSWSKNASYLVLIVSRTLFSHNNKPCKTHSFDTGSAWENLALQGCFLNLVVHALEGFDYQKAREVFNIPILYDIQAMIVLGKPGKKETLPADLQKDEHQKERKELKELISEGCFNFS